MQTAFFLTQHGRQRSTMDSSMWDQRFLVSFFTFLVLVRLIHFIKEECQALCKNASACQGFTHYNANASPHANFCETYPTIHSSIPCSNCVSGPSSCFCSGEVTNQNKTNTVKWSHCRTIHLLLGWSSGLGSWIWSCIRRRLRSTLLGDWGLHVLFLLFSR